MKRIGYFALVFTCAITLIGCNEDIDKEEMDILPIIFDESLYRSYYDTTQAPYNFEEVVIEDSLLYIKVSYSGGCCTHEFSLIFSEYAKFTDPPMMLALLIHEANMDSCNSKLYEDLFFNLTPLIESRPVRIMIKDDSQVLFE